MCSWCYGVAEELGKVKTHYDQTLDFEIIMGGLRPYNQESMTDLKDFLVHHWEDVNKASGQPFKYDILDSTITYDTEPPCRATVIARDMDEAKAFEFFKLIQKDFYFENKNMHLAESYHDSLKEVGLDTDAFDKLFASAEMKVKVRKDFERSAAMGVRGFPTIILEKEGQLYLIANGYATAAQMQERIDGILNK